VVECIEDISTTWARSVLGMLAVSYHGSSKELHFAVCRGGNGWAGAIRWRPDHAAHWEDGYISRGAEVAYCWCGSDTR